MSKELKILRAKNTPRLKPARYKFMVVAPLQKARFRPDVVLIHGNPGQIGKAIQAAVLKTGEMLTARSGCATACSEWVAETINSGKCQFSFPCDGERRFGAIQDNDMTFSMPYGKMEEVLESLKIACNSSEHRGYPVERFLIHQAPMSERYTKLLASLQKDAGVDQRYDEKSYREKIWNI